jgi:hypothetical protein
MAASIPSRRSVIASAMLVPFGATAEAADFVGPMTPQQRQQRVFECRRHAAQADLDSDPPKPTTNGDEDRYADRRASFSKTLPHNQLGEVDPEAYRQWLAILLSGNPARFAEVPRDTEAVERLNNPQATYAIDLVGPDATALSLAPPPPFASQEMAAEMAELYWLALMRDVAFREYADHPLTTAAIADLRVIGFGELTPTTLFRGETGGDRRGPFVSQFLLQDIPYGLKRVDQRFRVPSRGQSFLTAFDAWLACQRGAHPQSQLRFDDEPRYIASYRELVEFVHRDFSFQAFMDAALIIFSMGGDGVLSPTNPYRGSRSEFGDITFGSKNLLSLLAQASLLAQKTSYYYKWQRYRRARPEAFGGRIEVQLIGRKSYDLHPAILGCDGLTRTKSVFGSGLLPQAYPEGCPTHPSYPAAHAVNAGACTTVLKAFFDEDFIIADPVEATADATRLEPWHGEALTLGGEIDKLAANIALARDAAGVHFRSDSIRGLRVGEDLAIGLLIDYSRTYNERFEGFVLTRFDGTKVQIGNGAARTL